jgi:hypothetical protein
LASTPQKFDLGCFENRMQEDQQIWRVWADSLHRWGIQEIAATLLESLGPLTLFGAQAIFMIQPLVGDGVVDRHTTALARMLDNSTQTQAFITFLREGASQ